MGNLIKTLRAENGNGVIIWGSSSQFKTAAQCRAFKAFYETDLMKVIRDTARLWGESGIYANFFSKIRKRNKTNKIYNIWNSNIHRANVCQFESHQIHSTVSDEELNALKIICRLSLLARARAQHSFWCDFFRSRITFFFLVSFWLHFHEDIRSARSHATQSHFFSHFFSSPL